MIPEPENNLLAQIEGCASVKQRPDGSSYRSLSHHDEVKICVDSGSTHHQVQLTALTMGVTPERYARNQQTLNLAEQAQLLNTHVAVIGLGGLGGTVVEILARIGIGHLTLVDGDRFDDSNLNRQLLSCIDHLGRYKAEVAEDRVTAINGATTARCFKEFYTTTNTDRILDGVDIAVDCLDSIPDRFLLEQGCRSHHIPLVSAAIGGESGQALTIYPEDQGLTMIYGPRPGKRKSGAEASLGTMPYAAVTMAAIECAEVIQIALDKKPRLRNRLLFNDLNNFSQEQIVFGDKE